MCNLSKSDLFISLGCVYIYNTNINTLGGGEVSNLSTFCRLQLCKCETNATYFKTCKLSLLTKDLISCTHKQWSDAQWFNFLHFLWFCCILLYFFCNNLFFCVYFLSCILLVFFSLFPPPSQKKYPDPYTISVNLLLFRRNEREIKKEKKNSFTCVLFSSACCINILF